MLHYYVIDLETTGLDTSKHEVFEISIIRCKDKVQLCRQIKCEHPDTASLDALRITNKTLNDLYLGFSKEEVVNECDNFFNEDNATPAHRVIVGHNIIAFDKKFLHSLWQKVNKCFPANLYLDTMQLSREFAKKQGIVKPKVNLEAACNLLGVKMLGSKHSAKSDSRNTYLLHKKLVEEKQIDYLPFIKTAIHNWGTE